MSLVRQNLMNQKGYTPYCGNLTCSVMPRTRFTGEQFRCSCCGWTSSFEKEFIEEYKTKWCLDKR